TKAPRMARRFFMATSFIHAAKSTFVRPPRISALPPVHHRRAVRCLASFARNYQPRRDVDGRARLLWTKRNGTRLQISIFVARGRTSFLGTGQITLWQGTFVTENWGCA